MIDKKTVSGVVAVMLTIVVVAYAVSEIRSAATPSSGTTHAFENSLENTGTAYLTVSKHDEFKTAKITGELLISDTIQLTIYVNGTMIDNRSVTSSENTNLNVLNYIQNGQNSWTVNIDNTERLTAPYITKLTVISYEKSVSEKINEITDQRFPTVFTLLMLVAIVTVIVVVLRAFGAI